MANDKIQIDLVLNDKDFKKGINNATKGTEKLGNTGGMAAKGFQKLGTALAAAFAVDKLISFGSAVISITAEFQKFEAVLTNTLGSSSQAQEAMQMIKEFAESTPFAVNELTESFVKLANQGFKPTTDEMTKLGDLASAMGKDFMQLTEGIIAAQTGEFERLKEFGIRASKEGDRVKFTFKGVETQTEFTSDAIRAYILSLGELEGVTGGMAAISATLGGKISNLGDAWDSLMLAMGSQSKGIMSDVVDTLNDIITGIGMLLAAQEELTKNEEDLEKQTSLLVARFNLGAVTVKDITTEIKRLNGEIEKAGPLYTETEDGVKIFSITTLKLNDALKVQEDALKKITEEQDKLKAEANSTVGAIGNLENQIELLNDKIKKASESELPALNRELEILKLRLEALKNVGTIQIVEKIEIKEAQEQKVTAETPEPVGEVQPEPPIQKQREFNEELALTREVLESFGFLAADAFGALSDSMIDAAVSGEDMHEALQKTLQAILADIMKLIIKLIIMNALFPGAGGMAAGIGGALFGLASNAQGTPNFGGGLSMVGEYGPELVSLPGGASIASASRTSSLMGGGELTGKLYGSDILISTKRVQSNRMR